MTKDNDFNRQMEAAREAMDRYREALSAVAGNDKNTSEEFERQLNAARERMEKYKTVYRALAK